MNIPSVLLVDDDRISNNISKGVIDRLKFADDIIIKTDGRDALRFLEDECSAHGNYPDLILLDLKMPGMDGFDFLEKFEFACRNFRKEIAVVILTSSRHPDDYIRLRELGKYYVLNKPLTYEKLSDVYHRYFRDRKIPS